MWKVEINRQNWYKFWLVSGIANGKMQNGLSKVSTLFMLTKVYDSNPNMLRKSVSKRLFIDRIIQQVLAFN